jgi:hypothetical protein
MSLDTKHLFVERYYHNTHTVVKDVTFYLKQTVKFRRGVEL